ncbi:MAG TPA: hypothetical protein VFB78_06530 [Acidimicrobiales bacterium]|nr:hypothetical protein [Acidimicrobiales bacterium]
MRRAGWSLTVIVGMGLLFTVVLGGGSGGMPLPLPIILVVGLAAVLLLRSRPVRTIELGWSGGGAVARPLAEIPLRPASTPRAGGRSVAWSLARVEAKELVASPWYAAGVGFWLVLLVMFGLLFVDDINRSWWEFFGLATMFCHPFAGMAIVAAHRNRTRSHRDHCDELFDACPADANARTLGHLTTAWVGAATCVVGLGLFVLTIRAGNARSYGPIDGEALAAFISSAAIGAGAVVLGVTLGRWARFVLVPFAAVGAVLFVDARIQSIGLPGWSPNRYLATFASSVGMDTIFFTRPVWSRALWLLALAVIVGALGLLGTRRGHVVAAAAAAVGLIAAVLIVQPATTSEVRTIAGRILDPVAHQTCQLAHPEVRVCAYPEYRELADRTADAVRPVAAAVPAGVLDDVVFLTRFDHQNRELQDEVREVVEDHIPTLPAHALRIRYFATQKNESAARLRLAAYAVGLPTEPTLMGRPEIVAGQARGVIVLWLASRGLTGKPLHKMVNEVPGPEGEKWDATDRGSIWPGGCEGEDPVLQWSPTDLAAARALLAVPASTVQSVLASQWARWIAPTTTVDELVVAAGLAPLGAPERVESRDMRC